MQLNAWTSNLTEARVDCLTVFVDQDSNLISQYTKELTDFAAGLADSEALGQNAGAHLLVPIIGNEIAKALLLYRLPSLPLSSEKVRELATKLSAQLIRINFAKAGIDLSSIPSAIDTSEQNSNLSLEIGYSLINSAYRFDEFKSKKHPTPKLEEVVLLGTDSSIEEAVLSAKIIGDGVNIARDLGNMPGNACTPVYLADRALKMASELPITTEILDEDEMNSLGMGSLLSVSAGSDEPARLIIMKYNGTDKDEAPHVLVGKGITFDTGGISLKPGAAMDEMKFDMCGAASVFGAVSAIAKLKPAINLVAIVAAAENMPSGRATKPGDVVTSMSGQTIEVLNTDAEGRLVLCDALTYAARFQPKTIVDIATLTGACVIALGSHASGLYANDDALADDLLRSAEQTGDKAWRMPMWPEYDKQLASNFADIANIGGREAGSVTAACFLSRFTKEQTWAHLDIAGTAWKGGKAKGATGRPVRLLVDYLMAQSSIRAST